MRLLGSAALGVAAIVTSVVAVPATAAAPGYVASATSNCGNGVETITLRQQQISADMTHVVIIGTNVRNGRWKGAYNPNIDSGDVGGDVDLKVRVVDHSFQVELDVPGAADRFPMVYLNRRGTTCSIGYNGKAKSFTVTGYDTGLVARFPESGVVTTRAILFGCAEGSQWHWAVTAEFVDGQVGAGGNGRTCHNGVVKLPKTVVHGQGLGQDRPDVVRLVARDSAGDVRRIGWRVPSPVG